MRRPRLVSWGKSQLYSCGCLQRQPKKTNHRSTSKASFQKPQEQSSANLIHWISVILKCTWLLPQEMSCRAMLPLTSTRRVYLTIQLCTFHFQRSALTINLGRFKFFSQKIGNAKNRTCRCSARSKNTIPLPRSWFVGYGGLLLCRLMSRLSSSGTQVLRYLGAQVLRCLGTQLLRYLGCQVLYKFYMTTISYIDVFLLKLLGAGTYHAQNKQQNGVFFSVLTLKYSLVIPLACPATQHTSGQCFRSPYQLAHDGRGHYANQSMLFQVTLMVSGVIGWRQPIALPCAARELR